MNFNNILVIGIDTDTQKKIYSTTSSYSKSLYVVEKKTQQKKKLDLFLFFVNTARKKT